MNGAASLDASRSEFMLSFEDIIFKDWFTWLLLLFFLS